MDFKLNLGSSDDHKKGFTNVDRFPPSDQIVDLRHPWPWEDSTVDEIYAKDIFEHLSSEDFPGNAGKIWVMNESHRVLKPGKPLELWVPCVHLKDGRVNIGAFADPTHVSFWTYDDRYYFGEQWNNPRDERGRFGEAYGITARFEIQLWDLVEYGPVTNLRSKIHAIMKAVK